MTKKVLCPAGGLYPVLFFFMLCGFFSPSLRAESLSGDVNNDHKVTIIDALMIAQYSVGLSPPGFIPVPGDVQLDGKITVLDALIVAQYCVGLIDSLPLYLSQTPTPSPEITPTPVQTPLYPPDNPFADARWYVDQQWSALVSAAGGTEIADTSTAVWLDSIASIVTGPGLRGHLDAALAQGANLLTLVLYNLPNRACGLEANSELLVAEDGARRYCYEFIDPIYAILAEPVYRNLRIVVIIEPGSWPYLISGLDRPFCAMANSAYTQCIQYTLNTFNQLDNIYNYLDMAGANWFGWDSNISPAVDFITRLIKGTAGELESIAGFALNMGGYTPLEEPFLPDPDMKLGDAPLRSSQFFEYNRYFGELAFAESLYAQFVSRGYPETTGIIIDTSRNGWGGPERPQEISASQDLETYVNESRVDRREHRGNWCNQPGGIGEIPRANPVPFVDAYIWGWPPGYSDGASRAADLNPDKSWETLVPMCIPGRPNLHNSNFTTGAMAGAPAWGEWFPEHFKLLLRNACPSL